MTDATPIILQPGHYWIGDPCYAVSRRNWRDFLDSIDPTTGAATKDGQPCAAFRTGSGDGTYPDQERHLYPVDSGLIAAIPQTATDADALEPGQPSLGTMSRLVHIDHPFQCSEKEHHLLFGPIEIYCR